MDVIKNLVGSTAIRGPSLDRIQSSIYQHYQYLLHPLPNDSTSSSYSSLTFSISLQGTCPHQNIENTANTLNAANAVKNIY